MIKTKVAF